MITVKGVITPVITGVICDHGVITKYFYWGISVNFDFTFKCRRIDFVVYFRILKCFRGGEGDL